MSFSTPNSGGVLDRHPTDQSIIRDLQYRIAALENNLPITHEIKSPLTAVAVQHGRGRLVSVQVWDEVGNQITDIAISQHNPVTHQADLNIVRLSRTEPFQGSVVIA